MTSYALRRLGASLLLLFLVLTVTFFFIHLAPGSPEELLTDGRVSDAQRAEIRRAYGLDRPPLERYLVWMGSVLRGDWGTSFASGRPALQVVLEKMPATLLLALATLLVEHAVGLPLGLFAARRAGGFGDKTARVITLVLYAVPTFWLAILAIDLLAVHWPLFPPAQMTSAGAAEMTPMGRLLDLLYHLALPATVLGLARCGPVVRFTRNGMLEAMGQDYVRTARAKGLPERRVLWIHVLPNALVPLVQRLGVALPVLLSGSLVIEVIFSWPGVGYNAYLAILQRDYPVILATTAVSAVLTVAGSLMADLLHALFDPRVRLHQTTGEGR